MKPKLWNKVLRNYTQKGLSKPKIEKVVRGGFLSTGRNKLHRELSWLE